MEVDVVLEVSRNELEVMLESHMHAFLKKDSYTIETISPLSLFTHNRIDLAIKLLYLVNRRYKDTFSRRIYEEHVRSISNGSFKEPGNDQKNSLDSFLDTFETVYSSISRGGFDAKKSLIPISKNGSIINGAHRVACAISLNTPVKCVRLDTIDHVYDYKFFFDRGLEPRMLDAAATKFVETGDNVYIATIWPAARGDLASAEAVIPNVIYKKQMLLNTNGGANLISVLYQGCSWLGNSTQGFPGVSAKLVECFIGQNPVTAIAFQAPTLTAVLDIKNKIRDVFGIGKHSVHITDTKEEAVTAAHMLFNDNAIHFLNHAKPSKFQSTFEKIRIFKRFLENNSAISEEFVIDAGTVLSLYGLREADDIDYMYAGEKPITLITKNVNHHQDSLQYHESSEADLVMNPMNYFYFDGVKFISFSQLYRMKQNRLQEKDKNDLMIMRGMVENNRVLATLGIARQKLAFARIRLYHLSLKVLQTIGLYKLVRWVYRNLSH